MCCSVIASCFDALLPSRDQFEAASGSNAPATSKVIRNSHITSKASAQRKRSRARAFGAAPESDEDQKDYVPSDDEAAAGARSSRSTRSRRDTSSTAKASSAPTSSQLLAGWTTTELHYLTRKTSEQLKMLSPATSFLLFRALVEHAPQYLTKIVISNYFLPHILSSAHPASAGSSHLRSSSSSHAARSTVWLPASIPLLSHDKSAASFLVAHLTQALTSVKEHHPSSLSQAVTDDMPLARLPSRLMLANLHRSRYVRCNSTASLGSKMLL